MQVRCEYSDDAEAIRDLAIAAFKHAPHSSQTEAAIIDALREAGALTISLVAVDDGEIVGHVAFSPVTVNDQAGEWFGLGPVSVRADRQQKGIGRDLIRCGLDRLKQMGAKGCVVLGDPAYYSRFGFMTDPDLRYGDVPPEYFQRLVFNGVMPKGEVTYHPGFGASEIKWPLPANDTCTA